MTTKAHAPFRSVNLSALAGAVALSLLAVQPVVAFEPANDLRAAVAAAGAPSMAEARPQAFMAAFTSVLIAAEDRQVPAYAAAAIRIRPDLLGPILDEAVAALSTPGRLPSAEMMAALASATVSARPESAREIVRRLIANASEARAAIANAATAAAPKEEAAGIAQASGASGLQVVNLQNGALPDFNRVRSADALGTSSGASGNAAATSVTEGALNPANVSTTRLRPGVVSQFK
ncbi:MAG: hypothetical protein JO295_06570 [Verrucomicrobia bacterium]|nr:hypothetical protein [Verrucomicrobiota bacterium]